MNNKPNQQKKDKIEEQKSVRHQVSDHEGLLLEILSRLPVKSLMRFKCVSKQWESIIQEDDFFIDLHFSRSKAATRTCSLIYVSEHHRNRRIRLFSSELFLPSDKEDGSVELRNTCLWEDWRPPFPHQHCVCTLDGLVCFLNQCTGCASIYNISTRESTPWIKTTTKQVGFRRLMTHEFGYDHAKKEYKVLALWSLSENSNNNVVCEVLTVRGNLWRQIDGIPSITPHDTISSVCVNGSIYMLCTNSFGYENNPLTQTIVKFNVGSEKFRIVEIASYTHVVPDTYLMELNGQLCTMMAHDKRDNTYKSIKMRILYDHGEDVQQEKSKTTSNSNFEWGEAETFSLSNYIRLYSIQHIPWMNLCISIDNGYLYHYIWNHKTNKVNVQFSSLLEDETDQYYDLGFGAFTPNLLRVN